RDRGRDELAAAREDDRLRIAAHFFCGSPDGRGATTERHGIGVTFGCTAVLPASPAASTIDASVVTASTGAGGGERHGTGSASGGSLYGSERHGRGGSAVSLPHAMPMLATAAA